MGYKTTQLSNGSLKVHDVPLMGPQKLTEKHWKHKNIDAAWMQRGLDTFASRKKLGKLPYLWDRHNSADEPAEVIGRLDNLRIEEYEGEPWYFADVIITDEQHQAKFLAGKYPSKSVEFQPDSFYLRGLALLDGHEGHFDFEVPDFVPDGLYDELKTLGVENPDACTVLCHSKPNTAIGAAGEIMSDETINDLLEANKAMLAEMKALRAEVETVKASKKAGNDIDADLDALRQEERDRYNAQVAKVQRAAKVDAYVAQLSAKTKTPASLVRKTLEKFSTDEGMDVYFKAAMEKREEDVRLGIEREHNDGPDLDEEFANFKANNPDTTVTLSKYKELANYKPRNWRDEGRTVTAVRDAGGAFVNA